MHKQHHNPLSVFMGGLVPKRDGARLDAFGVHGALLLGLFRIVGIDAKDLANLPNCRVDRCEFAANAFPDAAMV